MQWKKLWYFTLSPAGIVEVSDYPDEDFLMVKNEEPETWSETIEKKVEWKTFTQWTDPVKNSYS